MNPIYASPAVILDLMVLEFFIFGLLKEVSL